jgi:hypothetical protein
MTETQALLGKIAALRQRLEQARGLAEDAGSAAAALLEVGPDRPDPVGALRRKVALGNQSAALLDRALRPLPGAAGAAETEEVPDHLTARARRLVPRLRDVLAHLRGLADEPLLHDGEDDPAAALLRETTALAELAVRVLQTLPEAPGLQLRLCDGVEAVAGAAGRRVAALGRILAQRREEKGQVDSLARLLAALAAGGAADPAACLALAEAVLGEVAAARPLRFLYTAPDADPARFVACHSLTVARVAARAARALPEWRGRLQQVVLAALLHDVGMLRVPADVLACPRALDEAQRRELERHVAAGADILSRLGPEAAWLREAVAGHHERLDGTGYPAGLRDLQIGPLAGLLAVCDVYAALCCPRPHRPALDTRTALTDTLILAQQGGLRSDCAQALLTLSLYPAGTAVELADGALGVVVATHQGSKDVQSCARPVVALLTDGQGRPLPFPSPLDLAESEGRSIVRSLPAGERRRLLGGAYPEWT